MLLGDHSPLVVRAAQGVGALLRRKRYRTTPRRPKVVSHRGDARAAPENTRAAFEAALAAGTDGIELDLCMTKDGVVVLWHDADPDGRIALYRQSGIDGSAYRPKVPPVGSALRRPVPELTFSELHEHFGYVAEEDETSDFHRIERLDELAPWLERSAFDPLVLDMKLRPTDLAQAEPLADVLVELCRTYPRLLDRALHVFTPELEVFGALQSALAQRPELGAMRLTADFELPGIVRTARRIGARHVGIGTTVRRLWASVREEIADAVIARDQGVLDTVTVWTVENPKALADLQRLGVDAVLTDDVAAARRALSRLGP